MAIKQLLNTNKSEQKDIIHEIEIVSKLENPNIVTYYHHFYEEETVCLVMEFCSGGISIDIDFIATVIIGRISFDQIIEEVENVYGKKQVNTMLLNTELDEQFLF